MFKAHPLVSAEQANERGMQVVCLTREPSLAGPIGDTRQKVVTCQRPWLKGLAGIHLLCFRA